MRLRDRGSEFAPRSVHLLFPEDALEELRRDAAAWTSFPAHELPQLDLEWMLPQAEEVSAAAKVPRSA